MNPSAVAEMHEKAIMLAKCYSKQFGATLGACFNTAQIYLPLGRQERHKADANYFLSDLERFYAGIPFNEIRDRQEFFPLFMVRYLLPKFRERIDDFFAEPDNGKFGEIKNLVGCITSWGQTYRKTVYDFFKELRAIPGQEDFRVEITDFEGKKWRL